MELFNAMGRDEPVLFTTNQKRRTGDVLQFGTLVVGDQLAKDRPDMLRINCIEGLQESVDDRWAARNTQ